MIYLDYAATAPLRSEAREALCSALDESGDFANTASDHAPGRRSAARLEDARARFAALIGAGAQDIVFTSGATEANNLALLGMAAFYGAQRPGIAVPRTEHKSVLAPLRHLAQHGHKIHYLPLDDDGRLRLDDCAALLGTDQVGLAACMLVNNETGLIQNIPALAQLCLPQQIPLHVDAAQALGKLPIECRRWGVATMSFSAHKFGGPKGVGVLYLRRKPAVRVQPLQFGGGHERGLRSGTVALHQILAMVEAAELAVAEQAQAFTHWARLRERLWGQLEAALPGLIRNGGPEQQAPHILNVSFLGVDGEALRADLTGLAVSSGSACTSATAESSYVLRALGRDDATAQASLRFSFGPASTGEQIDAAAIQVIDSVRRLRALSPIWEHAA